MSLSTMRNMGKRLPHFNGKIKETKLKLKLDLHTHCMEATRFAPPSVDIVSQIVAKIKARGLDGIAITEHNHKDYGFRVKDIVERYFNNEVLIIPGQEVDIGLRQEVELYLPNNSTFRFLAHPGFPYASEPFIIDNVQGIEIENGLHPIDKRRVRELAEGNHLLLLSNSDAHDLDKIGVYYNEIDLEELYARAKPSSS